MMKLKKKLEEYGYPPDKQDKGLNSKAQANFTNKAGLKLGRNGTQVPSDSNHFTRKTT